MTDRRQLDRDFEAHVCKINGGHEVRAGESRVAARDIFHAYLIAADHNKARNNQAFAERLRARVEVGA